MSGANGNGATNGAKRPSGANGASKRDGTNGTSSGRDRVLRILHVSTDDVTGGAARCAYRLHRGLLGLGHASSMLVARRRSDDPTVVRLQSARDPVTAARMRVRRLWLRHSIAQYRATRPSGFERFSDDRAAAGRQVARQLPSCDVVNLHWIADLVDYRAFFEGARATRVVWTLHDMNAFTGGCHYDDGCGRFQDQCGACPQLGSTRPMDLSWRIWQRKHEVFNALDPARLHIVTPSRWLAREVECSSALGDRFGITVIPYGVDTIAFAPRDRGAARESLGIPSDAHVLLFAAQNVENRRKGFALLAAALPHLRTVRDLIVLTIGGGRPRLEGDIAHRHIASVQDDRLLSIVYSAADVLVVPSLQDNLPATILEAFACGLPVVGLATGGVPDAVRPGVTGALAASREPASLAAAIVSVLENDERRRELRANCRRSALEEYALDVQARAYVALYEELLDAPARVSGTGATAGSAAALEAALPG